MGGCAAINCSNHSRKQHRMFRFPAESERRKKWIINCRRESWIPGPNAQLCSVHFEESQFEQSRADGWKRLKQTAIPTIFDVPNPPEQLEPKRIKGVGRRKPDSILQQHLDDTVQVDVATLQKKILDLESENIKLKKELADKNKCLHFLSGEQQKYSICGKMSVKTWSHEAIIKGFKLRFALGKFGYNYLRSTGYPSPSYSTLNRRVQSINLNFGILHPVMQMLKSKVDCMSENDRWCTIIVDEMEISKLKDFDTSAKHFVGGVTLGSKSLPGNHFTVVLLRGMKIQWKQIIAQEITGPSTSGSCMKSLINQCIEACREIGVVIKAVVSDMGSNNRAMWNEFGVHVTREERNTYCTVSDNPQLIHVMADVPHLLKNLRSATLTHSLILPINVCEQEGLPSKYVSAGHIKQLWINEIHSETSLRSLHHLNKEHLFPSHFGTMNVATAVQLFNIKTAAALEKAVHLKMLSKDALTTAWWIRLIHQWFQIMSARHCKKGITIRNKEKMFKFLTNVVEIVQNMQFGKGWKPLQTGIIMSTLSIINLSQEAFNSGFKFFLPGRLTQDALENIFSQIRRKSGLRPTALQAKRAVKLICVSQFIADLKDTNYSAENDIHLFDISKLLDRDEEIDQETSISVRSDVAKTLNASQENDVQYMAGATINGVMKQKLCDACKLSITNAIDENEPELPKHLTLLTEYANMGGLIQPTSGIYRICRETERLFQHHKENWLNDEISITKEHINAVKVNCDCVKMPSCCDLKGKIIMYYLVIRCKGILKHLKNKTAYTKSYSSASTSKKCT